MTEQAEPVKVDVLIGLNPHMGPDGQPMYQKLSIVVKQADLYFLLSGNAVAQSGKDGILVSAIHNLSNLQEHQIMHRSHCNFMEKLSLSECRKQASKVIQPGTPEYFLAQRQIKLDGKKRRQ